MPCNICGSPWHETICPNQTPIGWFCPACGKGNAPGVQGCVHCAKRLEPTSTTSNWAPGKLRSYNARGQGSLLKAKQALAVPLKAGRA